MTFDIDAIKRRWHTDDGRGAHDYADEGCRVLTEHAFRDVAALVSRCAELETANAANVARCDTLLGELGAAEARCAELERERDELRHLRFEVESGELRRVADARPFLTPRDVDAIEAQADIAARAVAAEAQVERLTRALQPETLARTFHETYERLAPDFGYETRAESAVPWEDVPDANKRLMVAVCESVVSAALAAVSGVPGEDGNEPA